MKVSLRGAQQSTFVLENQALHACRHVGKPFLTVNLIPTRRLACRSAGNLKAILSSRCCRRRLCPACPGPPALGGPPELP